MHERLLLIGVCHRAQIGIIDQVSMISWHKSIVYPRLFCRADAAAYCGIAPTTFDNWVRNGDLPRPLPNKRRWDRVKLDLALNRLSGIESASVASSPFDQWKAGRDG